MSRVADLHFLADNWPTISGRLDEALALAPADRAAWLESLPESAAIKAKLRWLLDGAAAAETDDLLVTLPKFTAAALGKDADGPAAGEAVGPYHLLSKLGQGGMGTVWLAERSDGQPRRKVALKLPHTGWAPGLGARLARERDILASLEHPNIARLYDAGVDAAGRPWLALEYVDGTPIDRYCADHALALRERLALVLQVAAAVAHAHTRLVVHRDLKPTNILVTAEGDVRLLDFGIAKLLEQGDPPSDLTHAAGAVLTPNYASPEQFRRAPIGTPSDVYSLGVVAYEVLVGKRPYVLDGGAGEVAAALERIAVPLASRATDDLVRRRQLAGDLDAILNKALKKDPAERYETVAAFADDLRRHVQKSPVLARPDSVAYRTRKFIARHAVPVSAATLAAVALVAGVGVALWQAREARSEAARAEQVKDFALSIFEQADTDAGADRSTTAADLLLTAQARVQRELGAQPLVATELMTAIGYALLGQGKLPEAGDILAKAVAVGTRELGPRHPRTLAASVVYGEALVGLGKTAQAIAVLAPATTEARRQSATHELISALRWLSSAQLDAREFDAAVASAREAVALVDAAPPGSLRKLDAVEAAQTLANVLVSLNRPGQLEAARRTVLLAKHAYGDRVTAPVIGDRLLLATALAREGQAKAAIDALQALVADARDVLGVRHPSYVFATYYLGTTSLDAGDVAGAVEALRVSLVATEQSGTGGANGRAMAHYYLGLALAAARQGEGALLHFTSAAKFFREADGPGNPLELRSLSLHAQTQARLGRLDAAEREFDALARVAINGPEQSMHAIRLASLRSLQGRHDEAMALARTGADDVRAVGTAPPETLAIVESTLGTVLLKGGHAAEAVEPLQRAVAIYAKKQIVQSPDHADALAALDRAQAQVKGR